MAEVDPYQQTLAVDDWYWAPVGPHAGHQVRVHRKDDATITLKCAHCRESWRVSNRDEDDFQVLPTLSEDQLRRIREILEEQP